MLNALVKNKHFTVALIVTPILAVLAFFGTDYLVSERPHKAVAGESYPLVANPNCRYESGKCTLRNGDIKVTLQKQSQESGKITLALESEHALQGAQIALAGKDNADNSQPEIMQPQNEESTQWLAALNSKNLAQSNLQLVIAIDDVNYYAEVDTVFVDFKPIFAQDK